MKYSLLILFFLTMFMAQAQDSVKAAFYVKQKDPVIRLDTMRIYESGNPYVLPKGKYVLKAWATGMELYVDTIDLKDRLHIVKMKLTPTEEYRAYKQKVNIYNVKRIGYKYVAIPAVLLYGASTYIYFNKRMDRLDELMMEDHNIAMEFKADYENSISSNDLTLNRNGFNFHKYKYESHLEQYNRMARNSRIHLAVFSAGTVAATYLFIRSFKLKEPEPFKDTPLLSRIEFDLISDHKNSLYATAKINF